MQLCGLHKEQISPESGGRWPLILPPARDREPGIGLDRPQRAKAPGAVGDEQVLDAALASHLDSPAVEDPNGCGPIARKANEKATVAEPLAPSDAITGALRPIVPQWMNGERLAFDMGRMASRPALQGTGVPQRERECGRLRGLELINEKEKALIEGEQCEPATVGRVGCPSRFEHSELAERVKAPI